MVGALEQTILRLEAAYAQNRRFVADVSHELRTPGRRPRRRGLDPRRASRRAPAGRPAGRASSSSRTWGGCASSSRT
jgi:hypothetical protein